MAARGTWVVRLGGSRGAGLLAVLVLGGTALSLASPAFLEVRNLTDILLNISVLAIVAIGMTLVILTGGIDISAGSVLALAAMAAGYVAQKGLGWPAATVAAALTGGAAGLLNGLLVARAGLPPIIVTLGTMSVYRGLVMGITGGKWIYNLPRNFTVLGQGRVLGLPIPIWILLAVAVLVGLFLNRTAFGRGICAAGSNPQAARLSGVPVRLTLGFVYTASGLLTGLAAALFAARFGVVQTTAGLGLELNAIAAAVIGGTNIAGGSGTVAGTVLGAVLMGVIANAMVLLRISAFWERVVVAALILVAVVVDHLARVRSLRLQAGQRRAAV